MKTKRGYQFRCLAVVVSCLSGLLAFFSHPASAAVSPWNILINTNNVITVTNAPYNAVADGVTDNAFSISNAIVQASKGGTTNGLSGGTVRIPAGTNAYMCGPIVLLSGVNLQVDAGALLRMLPFDQYPGGIVNPTNFISGANLHDIEISGLGAIDGQGAPWWPYANTNGANRPIMIRLSNCNRELIQNITLSNSPMFHISISGSSARNTTVQNVIIRAPSSEDPITPSHNTDACDVSGTNILVQNCNISVGDDNFTCGGGTHEVLLTNNTYGNGHGISIGSFTDKGGVSNITVVNCTINGADNGIRIKSDNDRGGLVQNISYVNIGMTNVHFPIQIYAYYNEFGTPSSISPSIAAGMPVAAVTSETPIYRNIGFTNITATSISGFPIGIIWARTETPATNIFFNNVHITGDRSFDLYNVNGAQFINCSFTPTVRSNTFSMFNGQVIITNSAPTNTLFTFDGLTTNGYANSFSFYNALGALKNTNVFDSGPLTIASSTLTMSNNLDLDPDTVLNFTLGTNTTKVAVVGNLTLGGTNNISAGSGFTNGTYTLISYTGTLTGNLPTLNSVVAGYNYAFNTDTPGLVNLVVSSTPSLTSTNITFQVVGNQLNLSWPADHIGWRLQIQTNGAGSGISNNWVTVDNSTNVNAANFLIDPNSGNAFFRMVYP